MVLIGWFSIDALFINPLLIVYSLIRAAFVRANPKAVAKKLADLGLPASPRIVDLSMVGCRSGNRETNHRFHLYTQLHSQPG